LPFDEIEYKRWISQAEHSLDSAKRDMEMGDHDWSCFKAQRAAEFAVKGLLYGIGITAVGHSISRLIGELQSQGIALKKNILSVARALDRHYIPADIQKPTLAGLPSNSTTQRLRGKQSVEPFG